MYIYIVCVFISVYIYMYMYMCRSETLSFKSPARPIRLFFVRGQMRNEACLVEIDSEVCVCVCVCVCV